MKTVYLNSLTLHTLHMKKLRHIEVKLFSKVHG